MQKIFKLLIISAQCTELRGKYSIVKRKQKCGKFTPVWWYLRVKFGCK
jgi:hypothetical protein